MGAAQTPGPGTGPEDQGLASDGAADPTAGRPAGGYFRFLLPARVDFGPGAFGRLGQAVFREGWRRLAFVTTPGRRRSGMLDEALRKLERGGVSCRVYDRVRENPDLPSVADCARVLGEGQPDALVAVGGGSALDTAKAAGICLANGVEDPRPLPSGDPAPSLPTITVPTTTGSGSEVNYWAVITDPDGREKLSIGHPAMAPHLALVDPELLYSLPPRATLLTGLDALTHAVESFVSVEANWLSDTLSLGAVELLLRSLERAVEQGREPQARGDTALASLLAGAAMENVGLGLVHAMSHQASGVYDTAHGLANALLLPWVLSFNAPHCREKMAALDAAAAAAAAAAASCARGTSARRAFDAWLRGLYARHGLTGEAVSIRESDLAAMSARAAGNVNARTNPAPSDPQRISELYRLSFRVTSGSNSV